MTRECTVGTNVFFSKKKLPRQPRISNEGMDVSYRRLLSPAEKMAYEINSVYDKAKSDGLTSKLIQPTVFVAYSHNIF